jgi:hypothetical protein
MRAMKVWKSVMFLTRMAWVAMVVLVVVVDVSTAVD